MAKLDRDGVAWSGLIEGLVGRLGEWRPSGMTSERTCRDSLVEYLRGCVPSDCRVEPEYRHEGNTLDIYLSWKGVIWNDEVFFELKWNLSQKTEYDRLVGQIEGIKPLKNKLVVVLCGETDRALLDRLRNHCEKYIEDVSPAETRMAIVVVS